jgi:hypothetical protein
MALRVQNARFAEADPAELLVSSEGDALEVLATCGALGAEGVVLHEGNLSPEFFELRSGLLGAASQKWVNYRFRAAIVVADATRYGKSFTAYARESRRHPNVRVYETRDDAVAWLESGS